MRWPTTAVSRQWNSGVRIVCSECKSHVDVGRVVPPQGTAKKWATGKGWVIGRKWKTATCPNCLARAKFIEASCPTIARALHPDPQAMIAMATAILPPQPKKAPPMTTNATTSKPAASATRLTFSALESYFQIAAGRYEQGWSDERVAEEVKLSPKKVAQLRAEHFGELREDPQIVAFRAELQAAVAASTRQRRALAELIDESLRETKATLKALATKLERLK